MRHRKAYRKLGRRSDHRKAMLMNLTVSLLDHEKIETTLTRAKELRRVAEKMITTGKKGTLPARREAFAALGNNKSAAKLVEKLFDDIAPRYQERNGGYTRIIKLDVRTGDSAEMALIELV